MRLKISNKIIIAEKSYKEGVHSEFDVRTFKAKLKDLESQLIELICKKEITLNALKVLLNLPDTSAISCIGSISNPSDNPRLSLEQLSDSIDTGSNKIQSLKAIKSVLEYKEKVDKAEN